jgi:hypothetical protein
VVALGLLTFKAAHWVSSGSATHEPPFHWRRLYTASGLKLPSLLLVESTRVLPGRVGVLFRACYRLAVIWVTDARDRCGVCPCQGHNLFDRGCRAVLLSPALFGLVEGLRLSIGPVQSLQWSHPRTYRVHHYARLHWAQGSRGTQLPIEPGKHLSCSRAGSLPHAAVMVVTAFWC